MNANREPAADRLLLALACLAFVSLGLPDAAGGVAWPSVRAEFALAEGSLGWILIAAGSGYAISSFFAGQLVASIGVGALLISSTGVMAVSLGGYALAPYWPMYLGCAVLAGLGSGAIDAGLNVYGARNFSAGRMNWLHACYGVGAMLGPLLMTASLMWGRSWRLGYGIIGALLAIMMFLFVLTRTLWERPFAAAREQRLGVNLGAALAHPTVRLQMAIFFFYTGFEATVGQWSFTLLTESRGLTIPVAGSWVALYWGSLVAGRVFWGFVVERLKIDRLLRLCMLAALIGAGLFTFNSPVVFSFGALACIGFTLAPIFPCLMTRTPLRVGKGIAAHAVGFQVTSAMLGSIVAPGATGLLIEAFGLEIIGPAVVVLATALYGLHELLIRRNVESLY